MDEVTAVVISFLRPGYTIACIESLRKLYSDIKIIVAENGDADTDLAATCQKAGAPYIQLPYDSGVCVARNALVRQVTTKYVLVGDDDFWYDKDARVSEMKVFLDNHPEIDLIGGRVKVKGQIKDYQGLVTRFPRHIHMRKIDVRTAMFKKDVRSGLRYCGADLTFNFFLARTEEVRKVLWDEQIKVAYEHLSWFMDFKDAGNRIAFTPDAIVVHKPTHIDPRQHEGYKDFRWRRNDKDRFFSRFDIDFTITMTGKRDYRNQ